MLRYKILKNSQDYIIIISVIYIIFYIVFISSCFVFESVFLESAWVVYRKISLFFSIFVIIVFFGFYPLHKINNIFGYSVFGLISMNIFLPKVIKSNSFRDNIEELLCNLDKLPSNKMFFATTHKKIIKKIEQGKEEGRLEVLYEFRYGERRKINISKLEKKLNKKRTSLKKVERYFIVFKTN